MNRLKNIVNRPWQTKIPFTVDERHVIIGDVQVTICVKEERELYKNDNLYL